MLTASDNSNKLQPNSWNSNIDPTIGLIVSNNSDVLFKIDVESFIKE